MKFLLGIFLAVGGVSLTGCGSTDPAAVTITVPLNGSTLSGIVTIRVETSGSVREIHFYFDGSDYGLDNSSPYEYEWDTRHETNDSHSIKAEAHYTSGDKEATEITVTVQNE